jgi:hypothetical protein
MLICIHFSHDKIHFCYNRQVIFVSSATFTYKIMGNLLVIYEFLPHEQFPWNNYLHETMDKSYSLIIFLYLSFNFTCTQSIM